MPSTGSLAAGAGLILAACSSNPARDSDPQPGVFPTVATTPGKQEHAFVHAGLERTFILYVPNGYTHTDARPLLVALHGGGGTAKGLFADHPLEAYADESGYVIVAAQGTPKSSGGYDWNGYAAFDSGVDDVGYLATLFVELSSALAIDPKRRFAAGFSGGATMTVRFASERSELITAIGTFAGKVGRSASASPPFFFPVVPEAPISVQMTYGTLDDNYTGGLKEGILFTSASEGIAWWTQSLGCNANPTTEVVKTLTFDTYLGCTSGTVVRMITVAGMNHLWPDKEDGLDGTKLLLDFFADKSKP